MKEMTKEQREKIKENIENGSLKFIGFISEEEIKLNKNKPYLYFIANNSKETNDMNLFLTGKTKNVYVYKKIKEGRK